MVTSALQVIQHAVLTRTSRGSSPAGVPLPPLAFRMGGPHFRSNSAFVASAVEEVSRLESMANLSPESRLLDWGCGAGRLALGLVERFRHIRGYCGVDAQRHLIQWAERHIGKREGFDFKFVDVANERYNPNGERGHHIPGESSSFDVFYAYSVFSHLTGADSAGYLREVSRLLGSDGKAFLTAFVEEGVPPEAENPAGYGPVQWTGPLHCVRYEQSHFESLATEAGLAVVHFEHGGETDGQSLYVLGKR